MASLRGTRNPIGDNARQLNTEEIIPSHVWTEDLKGHYLLVDLPDFKKEQVKIQVIDSGILKVSGERLINENKRIRFEETFKIPEKTVINAISAKFDAETEILYTTIPKQKAEVKNKEQEISEPKPEPSDLENKDSKKVANENVLKELLHGAESKTKAKEPEENICRKLLDCEINQYLRSAVDILAKNKGIVVTAVVAFSLGMMISRSLESSED